MYCPKCKVKLESEKKVCALCNSVAVEKNMIESENNSQITEKIKTKKVLKKGNFLTIFSLIIIIPIFVLTAVEFLFPSNISWYLYAISSIGYLWATGLVAVVFKKYPIILSFVWGFVSTLYLFSLNMIGSERDWFYEIAIPIVASIVICILISIVYFNKTKRIGYNVLGLLCLFSAIICIVVNFGVILYSDNIVDMSWWSLIVLAVITPISLIMFYIHYIMKKELKIGRFFHT